MRKRIDDIVKEKQRDVAVISFFSDDADFTMRRIMNMFCSYEKRRTRVIRWLVKNNIPYGECDYLTSDDEIVEYYGDLYIDMEMDFDNEKFLLLCKYLEDGHGNSNIDEVYFKHLCLDAVNERDYTSKIK